MKVALVGDTHAKFDILNRVAKEVDCIIQVGDFGVWPGLPSFDALSCSVPLYFCDGNHDNHDYLRKLLDFQICDNVWYQPRGSTLTLGSKTFLFTGGALSIDKHLRTPGYDWFPEEVNCGVPLPDTHIDYIISHTCPEEWIDTVCPSALRIFDPTTRFLSTVRSTYPDAYWYFGHWHTTKRTEKFTCLGVDFFTTIVV